MHLYLVVDCRTPNCKATPVLKYLGEKEKISEGIDISMPARLWLRCPRCELNHDFTLSQLRLIERDEPPPFGFRDTI